jgi:hypothetical protein
MAYNETPTITWDRTTPRDGLLFSAEFARIYDAIANYIVANGGSAPPKTMKAMSDLLDATVNVTGNQTIAGVKTFSSTIVGSISGDCDGNAGTVTGGVYTSGNQTVAGVKTFSSTIVGSIDSIRETGTGAGTVRKKIIEIGDWNMDSTSTKTVILSPAMTISKIRSVTILIISDEGTELFPFDYLYSTTVSGFFLVRASEIAMERTIGGVFDSAMFDSTSYNRGWITIEYVD